MKDYPFFKLYPASAMMDIIGKSREEIGDYFIALLLAWQNHDIEAMPKWLAENVAECQEKSEKRREAANARWAQNGQQSDANALQCDANALQRREEKRREEKRTAKANSVVAESSENLPAVAPSLPAAAKRKPPIADRAQLFGGSLQPYLEQFGRDTLQAFFRYWTEPNPSKTKMRFELEKTWDTARRLQTWAAREKPAAAAQKSFKQQEQEKQAAKIAEIEAYLQGCEDERIAQD